MTTKSSNNLIPEWRKKETSVVEQIALQHTKWLQMYLSSVLHWIPTYAWPCQGYFPFVHEWSIELYGQKQRLPQKCLYKREEQGTHWKCCEGRGWRRSRIKKLLIMIVKAHLELWIVGSFRSTLALKQAKLKTAKYDNLISTDIQTTAIIPYLDKCKKLLSHVNQQVELLFPIIKMNSHTRINDKTTSFLQNYHFLPFNWKPLTSEVCYLVILPWCNSISNSNSKASANSSQSGFSM